MANRIQNAKVQRDFVLAGLRQAIEDLMVYDGHYNMAIDQQWNIDEARDLRTNTLREASQWANILTALDV